MPTKTELCTYHQHIDVKQDGRDEEALQARPLLFHAETLIQFFQRGIGEGVE